MTFLDPWLLLAAAAAAVPVFLHLFHKSESRRLSFPALRYLLRTEREHARRIRLRQLVLLLLRAAAIVVLACAGARPFLKRGGGAHPPTALAIVLDNSMSSGRVAGEERVLDGLKRRALAAVDRAGAEDRIWVVRGGEPWDVATPGDPAAARARIAATEVSAAAGDLTDATRRAAGLVEQAGLPAAEVQVLSDLQATALTDAAPSNQRSVTLLAYRPAGLTRPNHYLGSVLVGAGLPPLAGRRSELAVGVTGDTVPVPLRLVIGDRIRGAGRAPAGASTALPFGPFAAGWVDGYIETDPDELAGDDRRWFALAVLPPPVVSVGGSAPFFVEQALAVLEESGRLRRGSGATPDVVVALSGEGAEQARAGRTVVVIPPADPDLLPALNRRLADADIPWRYEALPGTGELHVGEHALPLPLEQVRVARGYALASSGVGGEAEVLARLADGTPWLVRGRTRTGAYRLVGSPFDPESSSLPVSASMVPLLEWLISTAERGSAARAVDAGAPLSLPAAATAVRTPDGELHPVDPSQAYRETREAGVYRVLAGDSVLDEVAVNPPLRESLLTPADADQLRRALGPGAQLVDGDSAAWAARVFRTRLGAELWRPLLLAALLVLLVETGVAARGARPDLARTPTP